MWDVCLGLYAGHFYLRGGGEERVFKWRLSISTIYDTIKYMELIIYYGKHRQTAR
jgi:hypothetical protein